MPTFTPFNLAQSSSLMILLYFSISLPAQSWVQLNAPPFYRHHSNGFGYNDKAYVFEGTQEPNEVSNKLWEYSKETDSWAQLPDFPGEARAIAIGDAWDNKYYYGFGVSVNGLLNDLWEFDPVDTSFTQLPSCPCPGRTHPALIAHNDKIYVGAGSTYYGDLNDWWEYDITTGQWTQQPDIPGGPRHHPFFFASAHHIYVGGGHVSNWLRFDSNGHEWEAINNLPQGRAAGTQLDYNGRGFILGGDDYTHHHVPAPQTFMMYAPQAEEWYFLPPLPRGSRWGPSSFIIDDDLYFFGGVSSNFARDSSMWKFDLTYLDCLPPDNISAINTNDSSTDLIWMEHSGGADTLKWRKHGTSSWEIIINPQAVLSLNGLESCQDYEVIIGSQCDSLIAFSNPYLFKTTGCVTNSNDDLYDEPFELYPSPNPCSNLLMLNTNFPVREKYRVELVNISGQLVQRIESFELNNEIDLSWVNSGVYFLSVQNESFSNTFRVVKQ